MTDPPPCPRCFGAPHATIARLEGYCLGHKERIERLEALLREIAEAFMAEYGGCSCRVCRAHLALLDRARETLNGGS